MNTICCDRSGRTMQQFCLQNNVLHIYRYFVYTRIVTNISKTRIVLYAYYRYLRTCVMFSMNSRIHRSKKKDETTLAGAVFLFHFFSLLSSPSTSTAASLSLIYICFSLSLSLNDHYKNKKKSYGHIYHTLGHRCRETAIFILLL